MRKSILLVVCVTFLFFSCKKHDTEQETVDVVMVGGGIMSVTLANLLNELDPSLSMVIYERLDNVGLESSAALNNAGTGHAALCELNYTPELSDGTIDIKKAISVNESFELSRQFWSYLVKNKEIENPKTFINPVAHMSFVTGESNSEFLKKRYEALIKNPLFTGMQFSENREEIQKWVPLIIDGRNENQKIAATRIETGTDVNFGALTKELAKRITKFDNKDILFRHEVVNFKRNDDKTWKVFVKDLQTNKVSSINAKFLFIGAGGATLPLLEKTKIPEARGYGGFPVSGEWLVCNNPEIIKKHAAKVYGKAAVGSPPMSVPHLDTRIIDGKKELIFGPFAGWSSKFLKNGSWVDLPESVNFYNVRAMLEAGLENMALTEYLVGQVLMTPEQRLEALKQYMPEAEMKDWDLRIAGQRVQIIKLDDTTSKGILQFGTEVVSSQDGSVAALLGASPGASTSVSIMVKLIEKCFADQIKTPQWQAKMKEMIPSYGINLLSDLQLTNQIRKETSENLGLVYKEIDIEKFKK
ncbi:malate dehydrogenase (quinone) [Myroides injenensis]|uniref:malate dehydrogenase (quinone) n=1 Tax=Myroides injenensis TaxID=1183151 RepID=UPI0022716B17|nr:malate dehydrogenase (quinone) [Myroides injenensis]